jgi:predicted DNA-binding protein YlxM (UPF0122 family)
LPQVALSVADLRFGPNARVILEKYILKSSPEMSLSEIARRVGITKQAAHATFKKMIQKLREIMLEDKYRMCGFRLRPEFLRPLRTLSKKLLRRHSKTVICYRDWDRLVRRTWGISASQLGVAEPLILEILGFRRREFDQNPLRSILDTTVDKNKTQLFLADRFVRGVLKSHYPNGLTLQQLTDAIKTRSELGRLSVAKIRALVRSSRNIKRVGTLYRIADRCMMRRADQYHQILLQARNPLHYSELARRAVRYGYYGTGSARSIHIILQKDSRFASVGRSGYWALSAWRNLEVRSITQIAIDELQRAQCPLDESQLFALISKQKAVKKRTLRQLLEQSKCLKRVGSRLWTTRV